MSKNIDDAMTPSWFCYSVNKIYKDQVKLGFQTTNIHESDPLG